MLKFSISKLSSVDNNVNRSYNTYKIMGINFRAHKTNF